MAMIARKFRPKAQGLYDPWYEHDACGVGLVANIKGQRSNGIICQALEILNNLQHRGATGAEPNTGDGAGMLMQLPHEFFKEIGAKENIQIPSFTEYGVGMVFLPSEVTSRKECEKIFEQVIKNEGQSLLGWRTVPTNHDTLGKGAVASEPVIRQIFVGRSSKLPDDMAFERKLFVIRKMVENAIGNSNIAGREQFYVASFSYKTLVYKGMLTCRQLEEYFLDFQNPAIETALAIVHSRFSTNTFPSWDRAHPYRCMAHNGEINTLRGNVNWMYARQALLESDLFGDDIKKIFPIINTNGSDSAMFDNVLEFLSLAGRSLPHVMMMMIPEPWNRHQTMSKEKKAFYEYHSCLMEPWDGPASISFTDGIKIGAVLDRNGLRPSRYYVTKDGRVVMASEVGVLDIAPEEVEYKGRLQPGRMLLIDTKEQRIVTDEELKTQVASERPYEKWLQEHLVSLKDLPEPPHVALPDHASVLQRQKAFGYTFEDQKTTLAPMALDGVDPIGSMGTDVPLAVLSDCPQLLYSYFKQLFAQVTNPPIDAIREEIITATQTTMGAEHNLLDPQASSCRHIKIKSPLLTNDEMARLIHLSLPGFKSKTLPILFSVAQGGKGLEGALDQLFAKADQAIAEGCNIIILSDRGMDAENAAIPALLAVSGLHHHLIRNGTRTRMNMVLESGEPREVHHFATLIGYGVGAINPYLAFETLDDMIRQGYLKNLTHEQAVKNYLKGAMKGVVKVLSKVGISTIQSYRGAQIFEAVGLDPKLVDQYFTWTASRIGGIGLGTLAEEVRLRHEKAFVVGEASNSPLEAGGEYQWRQNSERHLFNPTTIYKLQTATRQNDYAIFKEYADAINHQEKGLCTLRGLLDFNYAHQAIPLAEVESVKSICKRFKTGAMSYGSISQEAHETMAIAMNRLGGKSNSGEGGEDPSRFQVEKNGDWKHSAIKQVASGRFGVTSYYLTHATEIQIKMAQGAKPGEGGQLPGSKVYPWIAKVRFATPGVGLISPPPHHDIYSIEDLAELIFDLKNSNPQARINVKLVSEVGVGTIAAGVAKAHADVILISGFDGGTGASPRTSIKHAGLPWELGLAETHQTLVLNNLRSRVVLETDGQLKTGRDVAIAALLGAEEFGFATAPLVTLGCVMMRVCHQNTCPVGVATQDPTLRKNFKGKPEYVINFMQMIAQQLREIMASLGFRTVTEMIGRTDRLKLRENVDHWKAKTLDFSKILYRPKESDEVGVFCQIAQNHGLEKSLDRKQILDVCQKALKNKKAVEVTLPIRNINRVVGTILGHEVSKRHGAEGLPEDTIKLNFHGSAGQSFGAFVPKGIRMTLEGDANDYIGKGLSGGKIIIYPPKKATFVPRENIIIGNVAFYGATSGEAYIRGMAGERFCVRNSGAQAVVEGVGDHGCEYMTGGCVVVLGATGRNFAAGMSGGIAYVLDAKGDFEGRCNLEMVELTPMDAEDEGQVRSMIERHVQYTSSTLGQDILDGWEKIRGQFVKILPTDYKRVLIAMQQVKKSGLSGDEATMAAFEANIKDKARVAGN